MLRFIGYVLLFVVSFVFFLYWMFPYEILKDRMITEIERQMGESVEVSIEEMEPYLFTGVEIKKLEIKLHEGETVYPVIKLDKLQVRIAILSALFGSPRINLLANLGKGKIAGTVSQSGSVLDFFIKLDGVDLAAIRLLSAKMGISISSRIDGDIRMKLDQQRITRSSGKINLGFRAFDLHESELIPTKISLAKGRDAKFLATLGKGVLSLQSFKLAGGDLNLDLQGKVFLSAEPANSRLNLSGSFATTKQLEKALPFLFIIEKQKGADGKYPLSFTGRFSKPIIKVGTFNLPL